MSWIQAVQQYAKETGKFVIPKKDSDDYVKIKAIQEKMSQPAPVAEKKVRKSSKAVEVVAPEPVAGKKPRKSKSMELPMAQPVQNVVVQEKKPRKPRVAKEKSEQTTEKPKKKVERLLIVQQPVEMSFK